MIDDQLSWTGFTPTSEKDYGSAREELAVLIKIKWSAEKPHPWTEHYPERMLIKRKGGELGHVLTSLSKLTEILKQRRKRWFSQGENVSWASRSTAHLRLCLCTTPSKEARIITGELTPMLRQQGKGTSSVDVRARFPRVSVNVIWVDVLIHEPLPTEDLCLLVPHWHSFPKHLTSQRGQLGMWAPSPAGKCSVPAGLSTPVGKKKGWHKILLTVSFNLKILSVLSSSWSSTYR